MLRFIANLILYSHHTLPCEPGKRFPSRGPVFHYHKHPPPGVVKDLPPKQQRGARPQEPLRGSAARSESRFSRRVNVKQVPNAFEGDTSEADMNKLSRMTKCKILSLLMQHFPVQTQRYFHSLLPFAELTKKESGISHQHLVFRNPDTGRFLPLQRGRVLQDLNVLY